MKTVTPSCMNIKLYMRHNIERDLLASVFVGLNHLLWKFGQAKHLSQGGQTKECVASYKTLTII